MTGETVRCRSCKLPIRWALTAKGRRMPLDFDPHDDGNVTLTFIAGVAHATVHGNPAAIPAGEKRFVAHFASCPAAATHRRRTTKAATS